MKALYTGVMTVTLMLFLAGCVTPAGPHETGGAVLGGATGAIVGGALGHGGGHGAAGAVIGGALGALAGALVGKDIDEATRMRVNEGQALTLEDIKALAQAGVADDLIISQIHATRTIYRLGTAQILDLRGAGVSEKVIDYMINTPTAFVRRLPPRPYDYYWYDPFPAPYPYYYRRPAPPPFHYRWGPGHHRR